MNITSAKKDQCLAIAELAMMAGEGIPGYFWQQSRQPDEGLYEVGARNATSEDENFSYRNAWLAMIDNDVAGMLLAYRLPDSDHLDNPDDYPEFIRPLIELENEVPGSFYVNMLASYPSYRGQGIGTALMAEAENQAKAAGCDVVSLQVFDQNTGALQLYERLGYDITQQRDIIPHQCFCYTGQVLLLEKSV